MINKEVSSLIFLIFRYMYDDAKKTIKIKIKKCTVIYSGVRCACWKSHADLRSPAWLTIPP